ncbi:MAG: DUF2281 domain-containing protein [Clostridiales bacterium]|nr:DUF2281 domain-containing protein [Clostridiales bacterium]
MQAIKAVYDGFNFFPKQSVPVKGKYEVVITFIEPINENVTEDVQSSKLPRSTAKGIFKDKVWMSSDFNEPLEELKEYME